MPIPTPNARKLADFRSTSKPGKRGFIEDALSAVQDDLEADGDDELAEAQ
jgi:hypothetical protein